MLPRAAPALPQKTGGANEKAGGQAVVQQLAV
jgi:hypothetical protein